MAVGDGDGDGRVSRNGDHPNKRKSPEKRKEPVL